MFDTSFFASPTTLLLGALTGIVFGFLLQKGGVTRYDTIVGQFTLRDFTVLKVMGTAMIVGGIGVYAMLQAGMIEGLHLKATHLLGNGLGGLIFGAGMVILGYCPGTAVAALGDGSRDAVPGIFGMFVGAGLFAIAYPWVKASLLGVGSYGKITLVTVTGLSPWLIFGVLAIAAFIGFGGLKKRKGASGEVGARV